MDGLAWDLGDPEGDMSPPPAEGNPFDNLPDFHSMKGPMVTQSLKGLAVTRFCGMGRTEAGSQ